MDEKYGAGPFASNNTLYLAQVVPYDIIVYRIEYRIVPYQYRHGTARHGK